MTRGESHTWFRSGTVGWRAVLEPLERAKQGASYDFPRLPDRTGRKGDPWEVAADEVSWRVSLGKSATDLLDAGTCNPTRAAPVLQRRDDWNFGPLSPGWEPGYYGPRRVQESSHVAAAENPFPDTDWAEEAVRETLVSGGANAEVEGILRALYRTADARLRRDAWQLVEEAVRQGADRAQATANAAKWIVDARNQTKLRIRKWDLDILRLMAEQSNVAIYGNPVGPTYQQLHEGWDSPDGRTFPSKTDTQIIDDAARTRSSVNRWVGRLRIAGRACVLIDIGVGVFNVVDATPEERPRVALREIGILAGAAAGGWAGAKGGGTVGAWAGPKGAVAGAVIGGIGGGIAGGIAGAYGGELVAEELFPPEQTEIEGSFQ